MSKRAKEERERRQRLRDAGLVNFDLWLTEENKAILKAHMSELRVKTITVLELSGGENE